MTRQMHLNLFIHSRGHHEASWRHPEPSPLPLTDIRYYQDLAQRGRGGDVRFDLPRRPAGARRGRGAGGAHLARADHGAGGAGGVDQPHRADRHRLDHLYRAVQPGAPVRLDRPYQRRPRRLEHRHLVARDGGAQFRRRPARSATPTATPAAKNSWRSSRRCGTAGPTMPCSTTARAGTTRGRTASGRSTIAANSTRWPGRSTCRAARRAGRCSCRRARPTPAAASPRAMPRRCSPRRWRRRRRRPSTPT